jgi:hypothetical protein
MSGRAESLWSVLLMVLALGSPATAPAAAITESDSTQPRGAAERKNDAGQPLGPVTEGFRASAYWGSEQEVEYRDWVGTMMANATRDPAFFASLSVANQDLIDFINSLPGDPRDPATELGAFLKANELAGDIHRGEDGRLQPEELLPVAADLCLRCHSPVGWLEAHSEPPTRESPFLKGQFWGAAFIETPVDASAGPRRADLTRESESEMGGISCGFCHRATDNFKRKSRHDGSEMAAGNGGFFVSPKSPFCEERDPDGECAEPYLEPAFDFMGEAEFCGTCHDVTNPLLKTKTKVGGQVPDMNHPMERTYTEWYWSAYRDEQACHDCHEPVAFQGAQSWMLHPVLAMLWGDVDDVWREAPYGYAVRERAGAYKAAARQNRRFMKKKAADVTFVDTPVTSKRGDRITVNVKVTNKAGHKLPTGFSEGRQMWIHVKAVDASGKVVFEDGYLEDGYLVRTPETKVYEQVALARGYPFLDQNGDGQVDEKEGHFRFVLMNDIQKDNRIPPKGYNKAAYTADGAFIVPHGPKDTDYADGQHWDVTPYEFELPEWVEGSVRVDATLKYQTFSRDYIEFLKLHDVEKTQECGGRARSLPSTGPYGGDCESYATWGRALYDLWEKADRGPPVQMGVATIQIDLVD